MRIMTTILTDRSTYSNILKMRSLRVDNLIVTSLELRLAMSIVTKAVRATTEAARDYTSLALLFSLPYLLRPAFGAVNAVQSLRRSLSPSALPNN